MTQLRTQFAEKLKTLRIEKQLTQKQLAKLTGLSTSFISSMERGINAPSFETLESLAKALNVPVRALFDSESHGPEIL